MQASKHQGLRVDVPMGGTLNCDRDDVEKDQCMHKYKVRVEP